VKQPRKPAKRRPIKPARVRPAKRLRKKATPGAVADRSSKRERVIALLRSESGSTIARIMEATGWQQHSVRGFLAGVVRKRLKLKLESKKVGDERFYRIVAEKDPREAKRRAA